MNRPHPLIKICGIRTPEDARVACEAGADVVGLVQADGSPRLLGESETTTILDQLPGRLDAIPVFTNPSEFDYSLTVSSPAIDDANGAWHADVLHPLSINYNTLHILDPDSQRW